MGCSSQKMQHPQEESPQHIQSNPNRDSQDIRWELQNEGMLRTTIQAAYESGAYDPVDQSHPQLTISGVPIFFPLHALHSTKLPQFDEMRRYEDLVKTELVLWLPEMGELIFISHQWTSFTCPDPTRTQFNLLRRLFSGDITELLGAQRNHHPHVRCRKSLATAEDFALTFIWLDYWSIPQLDKHAQLAAIHSIPAYLELASLFFVLAPNVTHQDTGTVCNIESWHRRGWCRVEQQAFYLKNGVEGTRPEMWRFTGDDEEDRKPAKMVGGLFANRADASIFNGDFTCCRQQHVDFNGTTVSCDKERLLPVVMAMYRGALKRSRNANDLRTFRKIKAREWLHYAGLPAHLKPVSVACSVESFLQDYEIPTVNTVVASGRSQMTALHYAAYANDPNMVQLLCKAEADLESRDESGLTPLCICVFTDSEDAAVALLRSGASNTFKGLPSNIEVQPVPILFFCAVNDSKGVARALLESRANVEQRVPRDFGDGSSAHFDDVVTRCKGLTPLQIAVTNNSIDSGMVALLAAAGADPYVPIVDAREDFNGLSAYQLAAGRFASDGKPVLEVLRTAVQGFESSYSTVTMCNPAACILSI